VVGDVRAAVKKIHLMQYDRIIDLTFLMLSK
jgi:hypothetical protein